MKRPEGGGMGTTTTGAGGSVGIERQLRPGVLWSGGERGPVRDAGPGDGRRCERERDDGEESATQARWRGGQPRRRQPARGRASEGEAHGRDRAERRLGVIAADCSGGIL